MAYPKINDIWNSMFAAQVITEYDSQIEDMDDRRYENMWEEAFQYNMNLANKPYQSSLTEEEWNEYENVLNINRSGMMGYLEFALIDIRIPIYHGTDKATLQNAVGHLEWTSLPVGGKTSHCVLAAHSGLPTAELFSNLEKAKVGDIFELHVLEKKLRYEIDQIYVVKPEEINELMIVEGEDYCTLVTCTPYGINTHRLLVRGRRINEFT